jgi:hypothetical protein
MFGFKLIDHWVRIRVVWSCLSTLKGYLAMRKGARNPAPYVATLPRTPIPICIRHSSSEHAILFSCEMTVSFI